MNTRIITILLAFLFVVSVRAVNAQTVLMPTRGGTGTSTKPTAGQVLVGNSFGLYDLIATSSLGISLVETDPIWSAFLLDPIFTNLTSTNFYATNTLFINATSTNLFVSALTFTNASGTSITSTNAFFTSLGLANLTATSITSTNANLSNLTFTNASGTMMTTTNLYVTATTSIGTTSQRHLFNVGGKMMAQYYYFTDNSSIFFSTDSGGTVFNGGYLYAAGAGTGLYVANAAVFRGGISNDIGANLTLNGGTTGNTQINNTLTFNNATGTSITSTNAFFTNLNAVTLNLTNLVATSITSTNGNISGLTFTTASGTSITSTNAYISNLVVGSCTGCGTGGSSEQRVGTSTANYFAFYTSSTAVTGTPWVKFASGTLTITTTTVFNAITTFNDETNFNASMFGTSLTLDNTLTTQNLGVNVSSIFDGDASFISNTVQFFGGISSTAITTTNLYVSGDAIFDGGELVVNSNATFNSDLTAGNIFATNFNAGGGTITNLSATSITTTNLNLNGVSVDSGGLMTASQYNYLFSENQCYSEGPIVFTTDLGQNCSTDLQWLYGASVLAVNGTVSSTGLNLNGGDIINFGNATGTALVLDSVSSTDATFFNVTINGTLTLSSLQVVSTTINSTGIRTNNAFIDYVRAVEGSTLTKSLLDREMLPMGTAVANTQAFYTDDITRTLVCSNVTTTGAISLKNTNLTPANTGQPAIYSSAGVLQTITASTLFGSGYSVRGCGTKNGYHYVMGVSSTVGVVVKVITSSYSVDLATAGNWRTAVWTTATPTTNVISIAGFTKGTGTTTEYMEIVSSSTKIVPATFDFAADPPTISPDNTLTCTTAGSATLQNTRAFYGGFVVGKGSAPFVTVYSTNCGATTYNGSWGQAAPSLTGPDLFVTKCSIYSLQSTYLYRWEGYTGC